ncbi:type II secretion system F family protein [Neobacillus cucumis]|uniref:Type II secretion system protein GspF domain-containing protein n=1 Tax=Neobacillus cucumis TaxID=1740721 RepID=A0A2N5HN10_9BACI|nr:type II secretion system F family protein [Neobacillus cucumis]PLS06922.1 hypothetical protein CVD27_06560 [Neobacillus cucumis]
MNITIELFCVFLITSCLMFIFLRGYANRRRINNRINEFLPTQQMEQLKQNEEKKTFILKRFLLSIAMIFKNIEFSEKTEKILLESGSELKPEEFFALRMLTSAGTVLLCVFIGGAWYLCAAVGLLGFGIPKYIIRKKRKKRLQQSSYQLIEILGMMANSMRAGFSFLQAMQLVGKEMPEPLGPEFERVIRQAGLGVPLEEVFEDLVVRIPNKELEVVVQAILAQRKSGGNLAELLETMEETIRGRVRILEELHTLTAQGRMSAWIITLLPVGLGLYLALVNKEYFQPMLVHPLGWIMLFIGSVSILIGWMAIQRIIKIEV